MQSTLLIALLAGLFSTGAAIAQASDAKSTQPGTKFDRHFAHTDKNGNGMISREEANEHPMLKRNFDAMDANKDGQLSREEMQASRKARHEKHRQAMESHFRAADQDKDGSVSRTEAENTALAKIAQHFDKVDADKNGKITMEEVKEAHKAMHGGKPHHGKGYHGHHQQHMEASFKAADQDSDGAVSREEAEAAARTYVGQKFSRLDTNQDNKLSLEELKAGKRHYRAARSAA